MLLFQWTGVRFPATYIRWLTTICISSSRGIRLLWPLCTYTQVLIAPKANPVDLDGQRALILTHGSLSSLSGCWSFLLCFSPGPWPSPQHPSSIMYLFLSKAPWVFLGGGSRKECSIMWQLEIRHHSISKSTRGSIFSLLHGSLMTHYCICERVLGP